MKIKKDELIEGSAILFVMIAIFNILNYLFQISMARMLGPADYGVLAVLMSFIYIFGIPSEAIQTIITRYVGRFEMKKENGKIKDLICRSVKKGAIFSTVAFMGFILASLFLKNLLNISFWLLALTGLFIFYGFSVPIMRGVLQGRKKFFGLGLNQILESFIKVIFSIFLVYLGWRVYGAMAGVLIGGISAPALLLLNTKKILSSKRKNENYKGIYRYNLPVLIGISSIVLIYSIDVIMARIFFSPEIAGKYSFVSLIGKVVLFSSFAISKAMFPIASERFTKGKKTSGLLKKAIILVLIISFCMLLFSFFIPAEVIKVISLGSAKYIDASEILFILSLAFSFTALTNIIVTYFLSVNRMRKSSLSLFIFVFLEVVLLSIFHSSIMEFSIALLVLNSLMLIYSITLIKK